MQLEIKSFRGTSLNPQIQQTGDQDYLAFIEHSLSRANEWSKCGTLAGASPGAFGQQSRTSRLAATDPYRPVVLDASFNYWVCPAQQTTQILITGLLALADVINARMFS